MSAFFTELFTTILTPGTSPALVLATNISFLLLQIVLLSLLIYTHSFHFVFLSIICAGLWAAINWFVLELESIKKVEQRAEDIRNHQTLEQELRKAQQDEDDEDEGEEEDDNTGETLVGKRMLRDSSGVDVDTRTMGMATGARISGGSGVVGGGEISSLGTIDVATREVSDDDDEYEKVEREDGIDSSELEERKKNI